MNEQLIKKLDDELESRKSKFNQYYPLGLLNECRQALAAPVEARVFSVLDCYSAACTFLMSRSWVRPPCPDDVEAMRKTLESLGITKSTELESALSEPSPVESDAFEVARIAELEGLVKEAAEWLEDSARSLNSINGWNICYERANRLRESVKKA